jgi:hypothetical protein
MALTRDVQMSLWQTPQARMRTSTCAPVGDGGDSMTSANGAPNFCSLKLRIIGFAPRFHRSALATYSSRRASHVRI